MHRLLEKLHKDHQNLVKILQLLSDQLDCFCAGEECDFDLKIEPLEYLETYADQGHHPLEDLIYDIAMKRIGDQRELLDRLRQQHGQLIQATRQFRRSLEGILQDGVMTRAELETQGREYISLQRLHLDLEEKEAFPLIDQSLTTADWEKIESHRPHQDDPVFEQPDRERFRTLFEYLSAANEAH